MLGREMRAWLNILAAAGADEWTPYSEACCHSGMTLAKARDKGYATTRNNEMEYQISQAGRDALEAHYAKNPKD